MQQVRSGVSFAELLKGKKIAATAPPATAPPIAKPPSRPPATRIARSVPMPAPASKKRKRQVEREAHRDEPVEKKARTTGHVPFGSIATMQGDVVDVASAAAPGASGEANGDGDDDDDQPLFGRMLHGAAPRREKTDDAERMQGARFRWLNEQLYTQPSSVAFEQFSQDAELFEAYHAGFRAQVKKWPANPVDRMAAYLRKRPRSDVVADFGCGDAKLAALARQTVHSFDLVAVNERVTACDMAHVPLDDGSCDVAIFCLSLMGSNVADFLLEAHRVLRPGGQLQIAEVKSRIASLERFQRDLELMGFDVGSVDESNKMFVLIAAAKSAERRPRAGHKIVLQPCLYKRR